MDGADEPLRSAGADEGSEVDTDQQLVDGCRAGDKRAWRRLLDRYGRLVYSIPRNLGLSDADAEDVAQATFAAFLSGVDGIHSTERLGAWLSTVARRQSIRIWERRERDRALLAATPPVETDHDGWTSRVEEIEWVDQALAAVSERCRRLLTVLYFTDPAPSYQEAAAQLGLPVGSIGPTRGRCLDALQEQLEKLSPGSVNGS